MADNHIYFNTQPLLPTNHSAGITNARRDGGSVSSKSSFEDIFSAEKNRVSFSQHAEARLRERNLSFSQQDLTRLGDTVEKMAQKGARESLIYMGNVALVVSVTNKKVITAMDGMSAKDNIFTNIDSAAII